MKIEKIKAALCPAGFADDLRAQFAQWDGADPSVVSSAVDWVVALRDDMIGVMEEIPDEDDRAVTLAINYIELKSRWIALNTKVNYETFRKGSCDPASAFRGTGVSTLIGMIEPLLTPDDVDQITGFLAQPIRQAA